MNKNLIDYISLLATRQSLSIESDDPNNDNTEEYSIPINLVSEEKMADRFIENIKSTIRNSLEYKNWVKWFKFRYTPIICSVSDNTETIEVHHHPLTLEDYVDFALSFIYDNNLTYTTFLVADLVMRWHYKSMVAGCYMSKTFHMRFHKHHDIVIPEECIQWDIDSFMNDEIIKPYINDYILSKICNYMPKLVNRRQDLFTSVKISNINNSVSNFRAPI